MMKSWSMKKRLLPGQSERPKLGDRQVEVNHAGTALRACGRPVAMQFPNAIRFGTIFFAVVSAIHFGDLPSISVTPESAISGETIGDSGRNESMEVFALRRGPYLAENAPS
jgi:hypothetical protein